MKKFITVLISLFLVHEGMKPSINSYIEVRKDVKFMASRCKYTSKEVNLLARLLRSEAVGEGNFGMLLVGNVVINRVVARCDVFRNTKTITEVIYQRNAFEGITTPLFEGNANAKLKELAKKNINGYRANPATRALWYKNPGKNVACSDRFYGVLSGRFKQHCFYNPTSDLGCNL